MQTKSFSEIFSFLVPSAQATIRAKLPLICEVSRIRAAWFVSGVVCIEYFTAEGEPRQINIDLLTAEERAAMETEEFVTSGDFGDGVTGISKV